MEPTVKAKKTPKKAKLRHAEYYGMQAVVDTLYAESKLGRQFQNLIEIMKSPANIELAYRNIKANSGSKTPGVDGKTILDIQKMDTEDLVQSVRKMFDFYQPKPVKRVKIPKSNGKTRPLGIPCIMDRIFQQCIYQVLEPICEAKYNKHSYGFRPNRSAKHAIADLESRIHISRMHYVVDIDIKSFFDNVNHGKLLKQMWTMGIRDKKLLKIISIILKAEVAGIGFPERGTPQGGIISPLLANITLNELDWWISSQWETIKTHNNLKSGINNGKSTNADIYKALRKKNLKECYFVRYADDFKILCRTKSDAVKLYVATQKWLKERLNLDISQEKSGVVNLKRKATTFLGFDIRIRPKGKLRFPGHKTKWVVKSNITTKSKEGIKLRTKELINDLQHPRNKAEGIKAINTWNATVMGWHEYYKSATQVTEDFADIAFSVNRNLRTRLGTRLKRNCENPNIDKIVYAKYSKSKQARYIDKHILVPLAYVRHSPPQHLESNICNFTPKGREAIHKKLDRNILPIVRYLMMNPIKGESVEYNDNRISLYSAQKGKCAITGEKLIPGNMHCHHKTPRCCKGTDAYSNLVFVTAEVHAALHIEDDVKAIEFCKSKNLTKAQKAKFRELRNKVKEA